MKWCLGGRSLPCLCLFLLSPQVCTCWAFGRMASGGAAGWDWHSAGEFHFAAPPDSQGKNSLPFCWKTSSNEPLRYWYCSRIDSAICMCSTYPSLQRLCVLELGALLIQMTCLGWHTFWSTVRSCKISFPGVVSFFPLNSYELISKISDWLIEVQLN